MYLTTIRIRRAKVTDVEALMTPAELAPHRNGNRLDLLQVCAAGKTVALVDPGRSAQDPRVVWQNDEVLVPTTDLIPLVKSAITLMDASGKTLGVPDDEVAPSTVPPRRRRSGRGLSQAGASA